MGRKLSILMGMFLIAAGGLSLAFNIAVPLVAPHLSRWGGWQLWPLLVVGVGLLFVTPPLLARSQRGLGALFIPGVPVLATGSILLYASVFHEWGAWAWLWPVEVLSLAAGFLCAAISMRVIWLLLPAMLIGTNGAILQFCTLTGQWEMWGVLWALELLSIGVSFLVINIKQRSTGLFVAGMILCAISGVSMIGMTAIFSSWFLVNAIGPVVLLLVGVLMLVNSLLRRAPAPEPAGQ